MKKMFVALLGLVVLMTLAACSVVDEGPPCEYASGNGPLLVGMDLRYPPFETRDEHDQAIGISVDIAKGFGAFIGCEVRIVDTNFGNLIDVLNLKDIDVIIASMSRNPLREELIDFSEPYMYFKIIGLMNKDYAEANNLNEDSTIAEVLAITDTQFVGITGQVSHSLPLTLGIEDTRVYSAIDLDAAVQRVVFGDSDILMMSGSPVVRNHLANPESTLVLWDAFDSSPIAMGIRQGETALLEQANAYVASLGDEGGVYEQLIERWDDDIRAILDRFGLEFFLNE